ncbi:hypothetical protein RintRC_7272 [Richelia intracellularis]|nr:hypothetical protein RintRC_7272 [Richelia intracellularis]
MAISLRETHLVMNQEASQIFKFVLRTWDSPLNYLQILPQKY